MSYLKRDIVKSPISFGLHGKLEVVGQLFLAESYTTKFNATFFYSGLHSFELTFKSSFNENQIPYNRNEEAALSMLLNLVHLVELRVSLKTHH